MSLKRTNRSFPQEFLIEDQVLTPGIVGGIGPLSHTDFERMLLRVNQKAAKDQDHPVYHLISATSMPDRTAAIKKERSNDPVLAKQVEDAIIYFINSLASQGADFAVLVCNTSHYWHERVEPQLEIPWLHMMRVTAQDMRERHPQVRKVGVLATDGTLMEKLYHDALEKVGLEPIAPEVDSSIQEDVMAAIYDSTFGIKATKDTVDSRAKRNLVSAADYLKDQGAQAIIAGCTEISVALPGAYLELPIIDPLEAVALLTFDLAMGRKELNKVKARLG